MLKKNVLLVIETLSGGGAELVVANLCKHIDRSLFDVAVCCLGEIGHRGEDLLAAGYDVHVLPRSERSIDKYLKWFHLAKLAKQVRADVLHSHSPGSLFDCAVAAALLPRVKHVHTFHFGNYPHAPRKMLLLERAFSRMADMLVAVGREQRSVISKVFGLAPAKIEVVWNGIEMPGPSGGAREAGDHRPNSRVVLCSISTLIEQKGLSYLLDAVKILSATNRQFELWIVGEGPLKEELMAKTMALQLNDLVKFTGWAHNAPVTVLPNIDVFVQSSLWEAMSMAVLEAMAAGKPVVVTDVGDNRHVIESGVDGLVVTKMDPGRMAGALQRLIVDRDLRQQLGDRARQKIASECTVEVMARKYERVYQTLSSDGRRIRSA